MEAILSNPANSNSDQDRNLWDIAFWPHTGMLDLAMSQCSTNDSLARLMAEDAHWLMIMNDVPSIIAFFASSLTHTSTPPKHHDINQHDASGFLSIIVMPPTSVYSG